jgi:anion-transporting  ArsA/GET3 family ATPase
MKPREFDLGGYRLVICLGAGGVGKTTLSAAFALNAALAGRDVNVMTVDPAPRLLDALGIAGEAAEPRNVSLTGLRPRRGGRLHAFKLDPKRTFDRLIERYAPSLTARDSILNNRIYQNLSNAMAGVADYMAMERLLELHRDPATNLIVLDTPPAQEAIDFLDAPRRMLDLLGSRAVSLLNASRGIMRGPLAMLDLAARAILSAFDRLTGLRLLADVQAFVRGFDGMYGGFSDRALEAQALLRADDSLLVVVTTAEAERVEQAHEFITALDGMGLQVGAVAVNRTLAPIAEPSELEHAGIPETLKRKLLRNLADFTALKRRELVSIEALRRTLSSATPLIIAPDLGHEPRTLHDLAEIAASLHYA